MKVKGLLVLSFLSLATSAFGADYEIDAQHSEATFSVRHMMVSNVKGTMSNVSGKVSYDPAHPEKSTVEASVDPSTIYTRVTKRDDHLKSPDFLDVPKFPLITFKSTKVAAHGSGKLAVTGDLTIHGVTKSVTLEVDGPSDEAKDPWGNTRRGASATVKLNRKDFGLTWNKALETGGVLVGEEVGVEIQLEMVKK